MFFNNLERQIENGLLYRRQKYFHWTLPRQSGSTYWLLKQINKRLSENKKVCLIGYNRYLKDSVEDYFPEFLKDRNFLLVNLDNIYSIDFMRGKRFDVIYGDNLIYANGDELVKLFGNIYSSLASSSNSYMVSLSSSEGDK